MTPSTFGIGTFIHLPALFGRGRALPGLGPPFHTHAASGLFPRPFTSLHRLPTCIGTHISFHRRFRQQKHGVRHQRPKTQGGSRRQWEPCCQAVAAMGLPPTIPTTMTCRIQKHQKPQPSKDVVLLGKPMVGWGMPQDNNLFLHLVVLRGVPAIGPGQSYAKKQSLKA